jgi:uncharacterized membrane protein
MYSFACLKSILKGRQRMVSQTKNSNTKSNTKILYFLLLLTTFPFGLANIVNLFIPIEIVFNSLLILAIELVLIFMNVSINFSKKERSIDKAFWFYIFFNIITNLLFIIWGIFYMGSGLSI